MGERWVAENDVSGTFAFGDMDCGSRMAGGRVRPGLLRVMSAYLSVSTQNTSRGAHE